MVLNVGSSGVIVGLWNYRFPSGPGPPRFPDKRRQETHSWVERSDAFGVARFKTLPLHGLESLSKCYHHPLDDTFPDESTQITQILYIKAVDCLARLGLTPACFRTGASEQPTRLIRPIL